MNKDLKAQRVLIKKQHKAISRLNSRKQFHRSMFKARVGFVELFRSMILGFKSLGIMIKYGLRDFVAFIGKWVVTFADKTKSCGKRLDWNANDYKAKAGAKIKRVDNKARNHHARSNAKARKLSHKRF